MAPQNEEEEDGGENGEDPQGEAGEVVPHLHDRGD